MLAYRTEKQKDGSHATKMTESRLIPNWQPIGLIPSEGGTPPPPPHFFALPTFSPFAIPLTLWYATRLKRNSRLLSPAFIAYSTPAVFFTYMPIQFPSYAFSPIITTGKIRFDLILMPQIGMIRIVFHSPSIQI